MENVNDPQPVPGRFARIRGADAAARGADGIGPELDLREPIDSSMQGKVQMAPGADMDALMNARDALRFQLGQLLEEGVDVEHHARTYKVLQLRIHDPGGQQMQTVG